MKIMARARVERALSADFCIPGILFTDALPSATKPFYPSLAAVYKSLKFTSQNPPQKEYYGRIRARARVERAWLRKFDL
jgi:hypothetical protein